MRNRYNVNILCDKLPHHIIIHISRFFPRPKNKISLLINNYIKTMNWINKFKLNVRIKKHYLLSKFFLDESKHLEKTYSLQYVHFSRDIYIKIDDQHLFHLLVKRYIHIDDIYHIDRELWHDGCDDMGFHSNIHYINIYYRNGYNMCKEDYGREYWFDGSDTQSYEQY